jgi:hypothetical protein
MHRRCAPAQCRRVARRESKFFVFLAHRPPTLLRYGDDMQGDPMGRPYCATGMIARSVYQRMHFMYQIGYTVYPF